MTTKIENKSLIPLNPNFIKNNEHYDLNPISGILEFVGGDRSSTGSCQNDLDFAHAVIGLTGTSVVPKGWNRASRIQQMREQLLKRSIKRFEANCPPAVLELFQSRGFPISSLPYLDIKRTFETCGDRQFYENFPDYLDFLKPGHLPQPLMRFEDPYNRSGVAIHIRNKADKTSQVIYVFQRYSDGNKIWLVAPSHYIAREVEFIDGRETNHDTHQALTQLLSGTHPEWEIAFPPKHNPNTKALIIGAIAAVVLAVLVAYLFRRTP